MSTTNCSHSTVGIVLVQLLQYYTSCSQKATPSCTSISGSHPHSGNFQHPQCIVCILHVRNMTQNIKQHLKESDWLVLAVMLIYRLPPWSLEKSRTSGTWSGRNTTHAHNIHSNWRPHKLCRGPNRKLLGATQLLRAQGFHPLVYHKKSPRELEILKSGDVTNKK